MGGVDVMDKNESGFSLIEVMIAMSLLATGLLSLAGVFVLGLHHLAGSSAALSRARRREKPSRASTPREIRASFAGARSTTSAPRGMPRARTKLRACFLRGCSLSEVPDPTVL